MIKSFFITAYYCTYIAGIVEEEPGPESQRQGDGRRHQPVHQDSGRPRHAHRHAWKF